MKTQIKMAVVVLGLMITVNTKAQVFQSPEGIETPTYLAAFHVNEGTFRLRLNLAKQEGNEKTLQIRLKDREGNALYFKQMDKNQRQATVYFDLGALEDGTYTFEISDKSGKAIKTFHKETDAILAIVNKQLIALN